MVTLKRPIGPIPIDFLSIIRRTKKHDVITVDQSNLCASKSSKRKLHDSFNSVPYGYKKPCE